VKKSIEEISKNMKKKNANPRENITMLRLEELDVQYHKKKINARFKELVPHPRLPSVKRCRLGTILGHSLFVPKRNLNRYQIDICTAQFAI
jgi:hypothetical protein